MAQEEKFAARDLSYGIWHRRHSLKRFLGGQLAQLCSATDVDFVLFAEYGSDVREPLALIEVAIDTGQTVKPATVTARLAKRANVPAWCVLYTRAEHRNAADPRAFDIERFRVRRIWPDSDADWRIMTPQQWAEMLLLIRARGAAQLDSDSAQPVDALPLQRVSGVKPLFGA